jgi:hypothetical protein
MAAEYQVTDQRVVDYQPFCLDDRILDPSTKRPLFIRGPRPERLEEQNYAVVLGAAQSFGRFCARPFPTILEERLRLPVLNISHGGAGPLFFCKDNEHLMAYLNGARFVVIQVMSGRSESNSLFESDGVGHFRRKSDGSFVGCDEAFTDLLRTEPRPIVARVVEETRRNWCASYQLLLSNITVPTVLLWFATRAPFYRQGWRNIAELFGAFPQLVNGNMTAEVRPLCDHYVECVSKRGLPQVLLDRFTGRPTTVEDPWTAQPWEANWYYPSPEMHAEAANALEPLCRSLRDSPSQQSHRRAPGR